MVELQSGEKIIRVYRPHWFVFFLAVGKIAALMAVIFAAPFSFRAYLPGLYSGREEFVFMGAVLATEILWVLIFLTIADYYLDIWVVTNSRVVFIELHGLFSRTVSSVNLENIQDVSTEVRGFLPMILRYGNVVIQSAGTRGQFVFRHVPNPHEIKDMILEMRSAVSGVAPLSNKG